VDACPPTGVTRGAPRPRGCPDPLPDRPRAAAWCLGDRRGHRGHAASRASARHRTSVPPCAHDGTERRIVRPQDPAAQTGCDSGKKKDHTVKNVLRVNALLMILFLSDTYGGRTHDKPMADATTYP
jgi:hypothetical protein